MGNVHIIVPPLLLLTSYVFHCPLWKRAPRPFFPDRTFPRALVQIYISHALPAVGGLADCGHTQTGDTLADTQRTQTRLKARTWWIAEPEQGCICSPLLSLFLCLVCLYLNPGQCVGETLWGLHTTEHWPPCAIKASSSSSAECCFDFASGPLSLPPPRARWCHPILWENATHWPRCITRRPLLLRYLSSTLALLPRRFSPLMRLNRAFVSAPLLDSPDSASILALLNHGICLDTGRRPNSVQRSRHPTEASAVPIRMLSQHLPACN